MCLQILDTHLYITVVVTSMTAVPRVHQDRIKAIHHWVSWVLRHVWTNVQELWIANILKWGKWPIKNLIICNNSNVNRFYCDSPYLGNLSSTEVGKAFKGQCKHIWCPMNCESFCCRHFLLTPRKWPNTIRKLTKIVTIFHCILDSCFKSTTKTFKKEEKTQNSLGTHVGVLAA